MATKPDKMVTHRHHNSAYSHKNYQRSDITQGAPIHMFSQWGGHVRSRDNLNALYLYLQKTHEHKTRQGADLQSEALIRKATWTFDYVTNIRSRNNFKILCFHYHKSYGQ